MTRYVRQNIGFTLIFLTLSVSYCHSMEQTNEPKVTFKTFADQSISEEKKLIFIKQQFEYVSELRPA